MNIWADSEIGPDTDDFVWIKSPNKLVSKLKGEVIGKISIGSKLNYLNLDDIIEVIVNNNSRVEVIEIHCEGDHHERVKRIKEKINAKVKTYAFGKLYTEETL